MVEPSKGISELQLEKCPFPSNFLDWKTNFKTEVCVCVQGQPSYQRLKVSVRLHIDQTMRLRNFRVRNEIVERGAVTRSQKKESLR